MNWIIALVFSANLFAQGQQQDPLTGAHFRDFSGGLVDYEEPSTLQPNQSPDLLNVSIDDPIGALKPRKGYTHCGYLPSGNTPTALYEYNRSDGTRRLIASDNANVYSTPDCQSWTTIATGLSSTSQIYFSTVRDKLWAVNGSTWAQTWDGTTRIPLDGRANTPSPTVPKCQFIEYWKERVWCGGYSGSPSAIAFSALTDSAGNDLDPSTGTLSWPALNVFQIDQNGGSRIYGMKAYHNRLFVFKDNGIWEIAFESDQNNAVYKTFASVGSRFQTSISEVDGLLYFVGKDGIYSFDGEHSERISNSIENTFLTLNQPLVSRNYKLWTTQSDFTGGTLSSTTATDVSGSVTISSQPTIISNGDFETGSISPHICTHNDSSAYCGVSSAIPLAGVYSSSIGISGGSGDCGIYIFTMAGTTVYSNTTPSFETHAYGSTRTIDTSSFSGQSVRLHYQVGMFGKYADFFTSTFTARGDLQILDRANATGCGPAGFEIRIDNIRNAAYLSSGTWTSDIYNTVSISTWGTMDVTDRANTGTTSYQIRFGTNTGAVQAASFSNITPGTIINGTTYQTFVQVKGILNASSDLKSSPYLDDITLNWNSGGANTQQVYSAGWKNRLWISASSGTSTTNNMQMQKTKLPLNGWMMHGIPIGPLARYNDLFYAASSTSSAIFRMDYGTNDDGTAINWHWTSRDEGWSQPYNRKYLQEMTIDGKRNTAINLQVGYSRDNGSTFTNSTVDFSGSGRLSKSIYVNGGNSYDYRFRIGDSTIDETATILGLAGWGRPVLKRE